MSEKRGLVIIGGGPGGYVAALRAAQLGKKATLIEEDRIGGICMNYGCIPTKFLLSQTQLSSELKRFQRFEGITQSLRLAWKRVQADKRSAVDRLVRGVEFLLERNGVEVLKGRGVLGGDREIIFQGFGGERKFTAERIILAMGSRPAGLPVATPDGKSVITHLEALEWEDVPKSLIVIGAGAVGLEIGAIYLRAGAEVTVLEIMPTILPGMDRQMAQRLERILKKQGLKILTEMRIEACDYRGGQPRLTGTSLKTQSRFEFSAEKILLAVGRRPNSDSLRENYSHLLDRAGFVLINDKLETQLPGVYAIGDLIGGKLLAHKASHEGVIAAENAAGMKSEMQTGALPMAVFTEPEFAAVGLTEEEARAKGIELRIGLFSLQANSRAVTLDSPEGMVKIIAGTDDRVIGAHLLTPFASEMLAELTLAIRKGLKVQDIFSTIHIHPTISESIVEAALKVKGLALHALND
ncbi:MAG: dihydrolipoyl dehydrogenase [Acidobacteriota bacterium]